MRRKDDIPSTARARKTTVVRGRTVVRISENELRRAVNSAVLLHFPTETARTIAELADLTPEGGKKIAKGAGGISLRTWFSIAAACPEFEAEVKRLLGMEADLDPDFQRAAAAFAQAWRAARR
jgi:hypothetical protein